MPTNTWGHTSLVAQTVKSSAYNAGDPDSIPGSGRSLGEGNANSLQYSCLENPMEEGARYTTVHGVAKSRTPLSDFTFTFLIHEVSVNTKWNNVNKVLRSRTIHFNFHECQLSLVVIPQGCTLLCSNLNNWTHFLDDVHFQVLHLLSGLHFVYSYDKSWSIFHVFISSENHRFIPKCTSFGTNQPLGWQQQTQALSQN